jgi:hypothetical protein
MPSEVRVDADHVRVTSDDGRSSALYEVSALGERVLVEVADHHADGTTEAYESNSTRGLLFDDGRGARKS